MDSFEEVNKDSVIEISSWIQLGDMRRMVSNIDDSRHQVCSIISKLLTKKNHIIWGPLAYASSG